MHAHRRTLWVFFVVALSSVLFVRAAGAQAAGAEQELVADGQRPIMKVELDRAPLRIDSERYRRELRASLERALAGEPPSRSADRVAAAEPRPRG